MITRNMSVERFIEYVSDKDLYIYGIGDFYRRLSTKAVYPHIHRSVAGYIDNGRKGEKIIVSGVEYSIQGIEILNTVHKCIVLLCGTSYLEEMYQQLVSQGLSDEIECFIMPLIWAVSDGKDEPEIMGKINVGGGSYPGKIDKAIFIKCPDNILVIRAFTVLSYLREYNIKSVTYTL